MSKKRTVAVCDDNTPLVDMMRHFLSARGFDVLTAADGREGLELIRSSPVDVLLLDLDMPEMDGLSVLREMKRAAGKNPYTIVISAQEGAAVKESTVALGAKEVWRKPFNLAELMTRIGALIDKGEI